MRTIVLIDKLSREEMDVAKEDSLDYLQPAATIHITGKMSYKESTQAWNAIHLRREIVDLFPQLKEKRGSFGYTMFYNRSSKELKKIFDNLEKKELVPILLLLGRVKEE